MSEGTDEGPEQVHVRPCEGCRVRHPRTFALMPPEGEVVPLTPYWLRRLRDGDVERVPEPARRRRDG